MSNTIYYNKDGWICERYPYNLSITSDCKTLEVSDEVYKSTLQSSCYYAWRVVDGTLVNEQYETKQWTDAERISERESMHAKTDADCTKFLRNIRRSIDVDYSQKCLDYIDSYNEAVSATSSQSGYPQTVEYPPDYHLPER